LISTAGGVVIELPRRPASGVSERRRPYLGFAHISKSFGSNQALKRHEAHGEWSIINRGLRVGGFTRRAVDSAGHEYFGCLGTARRAGKMKAERDSLLDRAARQQAELENIRKRTAREQQEFKDSALADELASLLPLRG